jgi:hypothetical protein
LPKRASHQSVNCASDMALAAPPLKLAMRGLSVAAMFHLRQQQRHEVARMQAVAHLMALPPKPMYFNGRRRRCELIQN